jgi:hypothetical protein
LWVHPIASVAAGRRTATFTKGARELREGRIDESTIPLVKATARPSCKIPRQDKTRRSCKILRQDKTRQDKTRQDGLARYEDKTRQDKTFLQDMKTRQDKTRRSCMILRQDKTRQDKTRQDGLARYEDKTRQDKTVLHDIKTGQDGRHRRLLQDRLVLTSCETSEVSGTTLLSFNSRYQMVENVRKQQKVSSGGSWPTMDTNLIALMCQTLSMCSMLDPKRF